MIKGLFSIFGRKEVSPTKNVVMKRSSMHARNVVALKKDFISLKNHSEKLGDEIARIKEQVGRLPDHGRTIDEFHRKHDSHERMIAVHAEKFGHLDSKIQDHRIDIIELKSRLNELNHSLVKVEAIARKVEELEKKVNEVPQIAAARQMATRVARASAPAGSLIEQYHSLAPSTKKIFSLLLNMHLENKGKWVPLSDLRGLVYPGEVSNSTLAAMAKAIRPLYENGFVEKKRDKSFVYVAASKKGRDAAKEAGLNQQAEKFDAVFAKLDEAK